MGIPGIYIVIVTWNGMKWLERCVGSIHSSKIPVKTIVVDNGSTDGTVGFLKTQRDIELIETGKNLGFGQANNVGIRRALAQGAEFVFLLNQDAYIYPDMFDELLDAYSSLPKDKVGILSPLHLYRDGQHFDSQFGGYLYTRSIKMLQDALLTRVAKSYRVDATPAAGWMIPKATFGIIGGFDPIFFHYGEDHNYAQRVNYHGLSTYVVPSAKMTHDRDGFGNATIAKKDMYFRTIKTEIMLNINLGKSRIISKLMKYTVQYFFQSVSYLFHGDFHMFKELNKAVPLNCLYLMKYRNDRRKNRHTGSNWL